MVPHLAVNGDSAVVPDRGHLLVLKSCASQIAVPITIIFNRSLATGMLPDVWLESVVIPLFKAKSRYDPSKLSSSEPHICMFQNNGKGLSIEADLLSGDEWFII